MLGLRVGLFAGAPHFARALFRGRGCTANGTPLQGNAKGMDMHTNEQPEFEFFASCLAGLEQLLASELKRLRAQRVRPLGGGVAFFGSAATAQRVCLWSRLASRVTLVVGRVNAGDAYLLYEGIRRLPWHEVIAGGASIAVHAHGTNEELRNSHFTELKVKDGICDAIRERTGERPNVGGANADCSIDVRIRDNRATISLDLSGASLYQRGYLEADAGQDAPLECALAAGVLALADWDGMCATAALVDAACGDGALVVEAAAIACDMAPGLTRATWGFEGWAAFDEEAWAAALDDADERFEAGLAAVAGEGASTAAASTRPDLNRVRIVGATTSSPAISRARGRAKRAGLRLAVSIEQGDASNVAEAAGRALAAVRPAFADAQAATEDNLCPCLVASCLPFGDRIQSEARAAAEASAFVKAAQTAPADSVYVVAGGQGVQGRFGVEAADTVRFGRGRVACEVQLFMQGPAQMNVAIVPDNAGGAEHKVEVYETTSQQFADRLRKVYKERRKWARREGVTCYRLYDADLPEYSAAIDVYEGAGHAEGNTYLHIAEYAAPKSIDPDKARRRFDDILTLAPVVLSVRPDHVFSKMRVREAGGGQYRGAGKRNYVTCVQENGCLFEVDLAGYLDTGIFLDHRDTRAMVRDMATGKRFLNLFAYTGSATVQAAAGGATETVTVDLSQTYLEWAQRNMEQNGFTGPQHMFERGDVMRWITDCRRSPRRFDLIFVDPPTFSNSKAMGKRTWDVQRDHVELLVGVSRLLTKGGQAIFSCNLRSFKPDMEQLEKYGVKLEDISERTIPHDFERNMRIHKCYLVKRA